MTKKKRIAIWQILLFKLCAAQYFDCVLNRRRRPASKHEAMGRGFHEIGAGGDTETALEKVERALELIEIEPAERVDALERVRIMGEMAAELAEPNGEQEHQLCYHDEATGYDVYAKPDQISWFTNALGAKVMKITDRKKGYKFKDRHWDELFMFGLIASLVYNYTGPICLVVQLVGSGEKDDVVREKEEWYSPKRTRQQLADLQATLREIDAAWQARKFDCTPGFHCRDCKLSEVCEANRSDHERRLQSAEARTHATVKAIADAAGVSLPMAERGDEEAEMARIA
jgi:hypothetical protein